MSKMPGCPECASEFTYEMGDLLVCSLCAREWSATADATDGDTVTLVKTLKVKGNPSDLQVGTKVLLIADRCAEAIAFDRDNLQNLGRIVRISADSPSSWDKRARG